MSRLHDDCTAASNPLGVSIDRSKLRSVHQPSLFARLRDKLNHFVDVLDAHLQVGDSRAALVTSIEPHGTAAHTDELDCAVVVAYDPATAARLFAGLSALRVGARLLTVNTYGRGSLARDLW